jgi:NAD(P)-dependent dehydrogenase (short-subunit alcohol dehydrogenase family)
MQLDEWEQTLRVNLTGTMLVTKAAIPLLKKAEGNKSITNISSDQTLHPRKRNAAYLVSKSGINSLTQLAAVELQEFGICVNAIAVASVKTNFINSLMEDAARIEEIFHEEGRKMPFGIIYPEEVAEMVMFLSSKRAAKITGQIMLMDSGLYSKE